MTAGKAKYLKIQVSFWFSPESGLRTRFGSGPAWFHLVRIFILVTWSKIEHENELTPRDKMSIAQTGECCYLIGGFGPVEDVEDDEEDSNEEIKEKADQQVSIYFRSNVGPPIL